MENEVMIKILLLEISEQRKTTDKAIACIEAVNKDSKKSNLISLFAMIILTVIIVCSLIFSNLV